MKTKLIVSIFDKKAEVYFTPYFAKTQGEALRMLSDLVNGRDNMVANHPEDFDLFKVGDFDEDAGIIDALVSPLHLASALDFKVVTE